jgi:hypothetical protein
MCVYLILCLKTHIFLWPTFYHIYYMYFFHTILDLLKNDIYVFD